jgi:hypothetical protein
MAAVINPDVQVLPKGLYAPVNAASNPSTVLNANEPTTWPLGSSSSVFEQPVAAQRMKIIADHFISIILMIVIYNKVII